MIYCCLFLAYQSIQSSLLLLSSMISKKMMLNWVPPNIEEIEDDEGTVNLNTEPYSLNKVMDKEQQGGYFTCQ